MRRSITFVTLFPGMFSGPLQYSILKRAAEKRLVDYSFINIRDFALDAYHTVDGHPYGGGIGMVMRVDILAPAVEAAKKLRRTSKRRIILLDPAGDRYTQAKARQLTDYTHLVLICGHYEGVDDRIRHFIDEEISVGDYILTGGELPALMVADSVVRLLPGVLKNKDAVEIESFSGCGIEYPQFTRPPVFRSFRVPDVLISGDHARIARWQQQAAAERTKERRPDLLQDRRTIDS